MQKLEKVSQAVHLLFEHQVSQHSNFQLVLNSLEALLRQFTTGSIVDPLVQPLVSVLNKEYHLIPADRHNWKLYKLTEEIQELRASFDIDALHSTEVYCRTVEFVQVYDIVFMFLESEPSADSFAETSKKRDIMFAMLGEMAHINLRHILNMKDPDLETMYWASRAVSNCYVKALKKSHPASKRTDQEMIMDYDLSPWRQHLYVKFLDIFEPHTKKVEKWMLEQDDL